MQKRPLNPNLNLGLSAREIGLARVKRKQWHDGAVKLVRTHLQSWEGIGEDIRIWLVNEQNYPLPHHHNAWGALVMDLVRKDIIVATGPRVRMELPRSHGHRSPVYRSSRTRPLRITRIVYPLLPPPRPPHDPTLRAP